MSNALSLTDAIVEVAGSDRAVLGLGMPRCPASLALAASLESIAAARPSIPVVMGMLSSPDDWALRERELWPRGIRVSRASVPIAAILLNGSAEELRHGAAPAAALDAWISERLGPPDSPVSTALSDAERGVLEQTSERRRLHSDVKGRHEPGF